MAPSAAFRIVARRRRLVTSRPAVLLGGLLARSGLLRAYTVWPSAMTPILILGASDSAAARWMNRTFHLDPERRLATDAATWNVLRASALVIGNDPPHVRPAVERALGRPLVNPRVAFYGTGGTHPKLHCFVFEGRAAEPLVVVKVMALPAESGHLERETANVELARERLDEAGDVAAALPVKPLWAGQCQGDFVVVEPVDPLAIHTGKAERDTAMRWLRGFAEGTTEGERPWSEADCDELVAMVAAAWERGGSPRVGDLLERVRELGAVLRAVPVSRCAVHGDFWRGNLAADGAAIRVYDWEWLQLDGQPFFDVWTFELGELRHAADRGEHDFAEPLAEGLQRVEAELERRGLDPRFALLTLAPTLGRLTFRVRSEMGYEGGNEEASARVMASAEELLLGRAA
jgi:hypothetical protein